jgi:beta-glucanase (GH16 family)
VKRRLACALLLTVVFANRAGSEDRTIWKLAWSDEFNGTDGSSPDPAKWRFDVGGGGWGNQELESYTARAANVQQHGGNLVITARKEEYTGADGIARSYTSGRIKTQGLFAQAYGRFEARMQLPVGKGIWPAFWMLGEDIGSVHWPQAGEIDVMECIGDPLTIYSTLHGPGYSGAHGISAKFSVPAGKAVNAGFHIYAVEWEPKDIRFYFDDHLIAERTPKDLPEGAAWAYDHPFFLLLNVAVGGAWPGNPDESTSFPQQMLVDYVRVYSRQ